MYETDERLLEWIASAIAGDEPSAEAIYRRLSPSVFRLGASLLNDVDDADEVTQDVFVYALRNLRRYDPKRSSFQTWLFTIAISRCRNKRRRKWLNIIPLTLFEREEKNTSSIRSLENYLVARGVKRELWQAVQSLSPKLREAVVLRFMGAMTYDEIGRAVGCNDKAAESRVRLAVEALKRQVGSVGREWIETIEVVHDY
jgi:RNA polymerase sigma-70 factor (ECF subfamily)